MAVAVSMLMIGGEFDLSAGAMTRARWASSSILLSKEAGEFGGAGLNLWIAIPLSFAVALGIGYINGWLVEKTKLPSFTSRSPRTTCLIGAKLGFSKLIVDQIQVGDIGEAKGYAFWNEVFAAEWNRTEHEFGSRDKVYTVGLLLGIALIVIAVVEMQFAAAGRDQAGRARQFVVGARHRGRRYRHAAHHRRRSRQLARRGASSPSARWSACYGTATWRFEPARHAGSLQLTPDILKLLAIGVGLARVGDHRRLA